MTELKELQQQITDVCEQTFEEFITENLDIDDYEVKVTEKRGGKTISLILTDENKSLFEVTPWLSEHKEAKKILVYFKDFESEANHRFEFTKITPSDIKAILKTLLEIMMLT